MEGAYFEYFKRLLALVLSYVFPSSCIICKKEGNWVCGECDFEIKIDWVADCPVCHKPQLGGRCCFSCTDQSYITAHLALLPYDEKGGIGKILHSYKYGGVSALEEWLEVLIRQGVLSKLRMFQDIDVVVPVPLHKRRFAERGFNQSERFAQMISHTLSKPKDNLIKRKRNTPHQARLSKGERVVNVEKAFEVIGEVREKNILLVDDVFTTGSTIQECARVLLAADAASVRSISIARG